MIGSAAPRVGQNIIGLVHPLRGLRGVSVTGMKVGVHLPHGRSVCRLQFLLADPSPDPQYLVEVDFPMAAGRAIPRRIRPPLAQRLSSRASGCFIGWARSKAGNAMQESKMRSRAG